MHNRLAVDSTFLGKAMSADTIDTAMAKSLVQGAAFTGAAIIGQPGGWSVLLRLGVQDKALCAQRTGKPRMWRSLDRCVEYLKNELNITRVDFLDSSSHIDVTNALGQSRPDASARLQLAHQAAGHDQWFREQVQQAIFEADDANAEWVTNEDASESWEKERAKLVARAKASAV